MTAGDADEAILEAIEKRVLWLAVRMVDWVNRENSAEIKVGATRRLRPRWFR